jgi:hypothetical protein
MPRKKVKDPNRHSQTRLGRFRTNKDKKYQNWYVWTVGMENIIAGSSFALSKTIRYYNETYDMHLSRRAVYILIMIRKYLAEHQMKTFTIPELFKWLKEGEYHTSAHMRQFRSAIISELAKAQFLARDGRYRYALTLRAQVIFRTLTASFRLFFGEPLPATIKLRPSDTRKKFSKKPDPTPAEVLLDKINEAYPELPNEDVLGREPEKINWGTV